MHRQINENKSELLSSQVLSDFPLFFFPLEHKHFSALALKRIFLSADRVYGFGSHQTDLDDLIFLLVYELIH